MLFGTDNVRGQISVHIFVPNEGCCLYNPQKIVVYFLKKQLNGELWELFQFLVCTANMNEVLAMNIINKFAESLGIPMVKLNIYRSVSLSLLQKTSY